MRPLGVLCAIALLGGCSGTTSLHPFGGAYNLLTVDGLPDPQPLVPGVVSPELLGGTMNVGADTLDVTLSLQPVDDAGRPTGDIAPMMIDLPYARRGDSLYFASDTLAFTDSLYVGPKPQAFGALLGSTVRLSLSFTISTATGFGYSHVRQLLFAPAQ
ncbi:MAG TPA: hypothetical protein VJO52_16120 [Gemmatimonadaceae bacterium]|nr:hypothetical protein [Gemmatimonadaceae bacterium]